jgi:hypothetical protein
MGDAFRKATVGLIQLEATLMLERFGKQHLR